MTYKQRAVILNNINQIEAIVQKFDEKIKVFQAGRGLYLAQLVDLHARLKEDK